MELIQAISKLRTTLAQDKEWTPEQEAAFKTTIKSLVESGPHWQVSGRVPPTA